MEVQVKKGEWHALLCTVFSPAYINHINSLCNVINRDLCAQIFYTLSPTMPEKDEECNDTETNVLASIAWETVDEEVTRDDGPTVITSTLSKLLLQELDLPGEQITAVSVEHWCH